MKSHRMARIAETVREVAAETILFELKDPRVKMVTVTRAEVSGDLQHAKIFVSVMGTDKEARLTLHGLASAAGFVQTRLAKRLATRFVPHVIFVLDEGIKRAAEVARLLREARGDQSPTDEVVDEEAEPDTDEGDTEEGHGDAGTAPRKGTDPA